MSVTQTPKSSEPQKNLKAKNPDFKSDLSAGDTDDDAEQPGWLDLIRSKLGLAAGPTLRQQLLDALKDDATTRDVFSPQERDMLNRVLRLGSLRVEDVMIPRADIIAIDEQSEISELLKLFKDAGHSRIPVFRDTLDDARGMIHIKDLLGWLMDEKIGAVKKPANGEKSSTRSTKSENGQNPEKKQAQADKEPVFSNRDLSKPIMSARIRRPILFVPPSMPAMNLLLRMQSTRTHQALVIDEYGGTDGLVSIEDLVEEVVGEIEDEHDDESVDLIVEDPVQGLIASARAPVEEFEKLIGVDLMPDEDNEDIDTLGGLVFSLVGRVPVKGELVPHPTGIEFEVLDADPRRIKRLKIHRGKLRISPPDDAKRSDD